MNNLISLKNISKSFSNNKKINVLKRINYSFTKGKIYSLVGPSGSGKSTLLNVLSLIDKPTTGSLLINKTPVNFNENAKNDKIRSSKIGIIYQQNNLLPDFTALENVYLAGLALTNDKKNSIERAKEIIKTMGLSSREAHFPSELSGGEMQRIAMARALINEPEIILADEPTGSLDHTTAKEVFNVLYKLKNKNRLIIYATHNRFFANMADCKLEMIDGNIKTINARIK
ncbi:ABC transporter ATP-binding protein [Candidatus Pelagibacter ubique]|jgi:ABC-type lipoprotein export system ATPase subunit|uniref:ABC transporter ATP-binding protein n=1 Tax=Pelagibacter ubique TaxID=198252 RepID=UPI00230C3849|nr:ABC transporter ATP-binding protein [Candidatus Pelagibacter ubique]MDA7443456.1 ABC transporter ATP-binding protein [Candidatus Pelagibacter ubique]MDC0951595.1 ABC transporter ATP-binding protein [Candidatus Pelagibacter ubique]MDC3401008.1 ABC transporter ATP-binding protein [Candidatus Pelagibacter ubique]